MKGDCVVRRLDGLPDDDSQLIITDGNGTPMLPRIAYQMEGIKKLLGNHDTLTESDQTRGIALDDKTAADIAGRDKAAWGASGISPLGQWDHKGLWGESYFYIPPT